MKPFKEQVIEALEQLPEGLQQRAVAYIFEQAEKYRVLKEELEKGDADIEAGRLREWDLDDFLRRAIPDRVEAKTE
jgi:HD-like signal output (HDOD) protein